MLSRWLRGLIFLACCIYSTICWRRRILREVFSGTSRWIWRAAVGSRTFWRIRTTLLFKVLHSRLQLYKRYLLWRTITRRRDLIFAYFTFRILWEPHAHQFLSCLLLWRFLWNLIGNLISHLQLHSYILYLITTKNIYNINYYR